MTLGLKDLYYAVCTEADGAESYGTPKKMAGGTTENIRRAGKKGKRNRGGFRKMSQGNRRQ